MSIHRGNGKGRYVRSTFADIVTSGRRIVFGPCPNCGAIGRQTAVEGEYICNQPFCGHRWGPLQWASETVSLPNCASCQNSGAVEDPRGGLIGCPDCLDENEVERAASGGGT